MNQPSLSLQLARILVYRSASLDPDDEHSPQFSRETQPKLN